MESTMTTINWKRQLGEVEGEEIPFDISFNVFEEGVLIGSIKAHKTVLAIASPVFKRQFFTCDTRDKNAAEIDVYDTTYSAFNIMIADVYSKHSLREWLSIAKIEKVFEVLKLVKKYMIDDQITVAEESLATFALNFHNIVESATTAEYFFATELEAEARQLHLRCVKILKFCVSGPDGGSRAAHFLERNLENMKTACKLLVLSGDINCPNCERDLCQHGKLVHAEFDEFKEGLGVMFTCGHFNFCSSTVTKDIGDNNMCVQDGLYLKDVHVSWDIDGDRLYYNCQPGEFYSIN